MARASSILAAFILFVASSQRLNSGPAPWFSATSDNPELLPVSAIRFVGNSVVFTLPPDVDGVATVRLFVHSGLGNDTARMFHHWQPVRPETPRNLRK